MGYYTGLGRDTILLKRMIKENKLLTIYPEDNSIAKLIKIKLNTIVLNNKREKVTRWVYGSGRKSKSSYISNSGYERMKNVVNNVNTIRQRNWFWDYINLN